MTRFVFDTNVIVSALLFNDSVPGQAFIRALNHGMILVSGALVGELSRVLGRDRFDRYVTREERDEFLASLIRESNLIEIPYLPLKQELNTQLESIQRDLDYREGGSGE